jgi:hypothetical protein
MIPEKQYRDYPVAMVTSVSEGKFKIEVMVHSVQAESLGENFEYETTSSFIDVIDGFDPDPDMEPGGTVIIDDDIDLDDYNITIGPDSYDPSSDVRSSVKGILINIGLVLGGLAFLFLVLVIYLKVRSS